MGAVDVLGSHWQELALQQGWVLLAQFSAVKVVLVDLIEVEPELRTHLFPEVLLEVADLAGILDQQTDAVHDVALLDLGVLLMLEKVRVGPREGFLFAG